MMHDDRLALEPFRLWMKREWLLVLITVGIGIDWLPFMMTGVFPQLGPLSGTRLFVLPGLVLAFLRRPFWATRPHVLGLAYLVTILIGGGLGWLVGTVPTGRLATVVMNGIILLYYMQVRSLLSILRVLEITFVLSLGVPIIQNLAAFGIVTEAWLTSIGGLPMTGGRVFSIFDTTTPGFIPLMIPACLGGLLFLRGLARRSTMNAMLAAGLVAFGVTSALLAQQRSGVLAYGASLFTAVLLFVRWHQKRFLWLLVGFGLVSVLFAGAARNLFTPATQRFSDAAAYEEAKDLRLLGFLTFLSDFAENPLNLVPIGQDSLFERTGIAPHLLVSEAYYTGGPLFLAAILTLLFKFGAASVRLARSSDALARTIGNCLCAFGAGAAIEIMLQTSLGLRIVPLILGVAIAGERVLRAEARNALARPIWREGDVT
jgi:hypothetical protein